MTFGQTLLVGAVLVPALGAIAALLVPGRADRTGQLVATVAAALTLLAGVLLAVRRVAGGFGFAGSPQWFAYQPANESGPGPITPWHHLDVAWVPALDLRFHLGVDAVSYPLVVLTALLTLLCCGYVLLRAEGGNAPRDAPRDAAGVGPGRGPGGRVLLALLLTIEVGIIGVFLSLDLVLFFVFFEVVLLPMYAVIAGWGGPRRRPAARKFVLYTLLGSVLLLVGVYVVVASAGTADLVRLSSGAGAQLGRSTQLAAFILLALAFAVKSPLWPLHSWLPDAHTEAPTVGSVILAGVLLKMGTYGLIRIVGVVPDGARRVAPVLAGLAVAAILVGGLVCLAQTELKRLIAYSSVGHMGFVLLGVATLTATGLSAALIGNIAHGIITGLLFFLAGAVKDRAHTGDLGQLGGLRESAPQLSGVLGFAAIASLGLPGLAGFWGEAFAVVAAVQRGWMAAAVLAALGGALAAAYFLRLLRRVTHGPAASGVGLRSPAESGSALPSPVTSGIPFPAPTAGEWFAWAPLVVLTLAVGLIPALVLGYATGAVDALAEAVAR